MLGVLCFPFLTSSTTRELDGSVVRSSFQLFQLFTSLRFPHQLREALFRGRLKRFACFSWSQKTPPEPQSLPGSRASDPPRITRKSRFPHFRHEEAPQDLTRPPLEVSEGPQELSVGPPGALRAPQEASARASSHLISSHFISD